MSILFSGGEFDFDEFGGGLAGVEPAAVVEKVEAGGGGVAHRFDEVGFGVGVALCGAQGFATVAVVGDGNAVCRVGEGVRLVRRRGGTFGDGAEFAEVQEGAHLFGGVVKGGEGVARMKHVAVVVEVGRLDAAVGHFHSDHRSCAHFDSPVMVFRRSRSSSAWAA